MGKKDISFPFKDWHENMHAEAINDIVKKLVVHAVPN